MKDNTTRQDKRGRVLRTADERQGLVEAFRDSGLGMAEFCRQRGVLLSTFWHWARRGKDGRLPSSAGKQRRTAVKFAEVQVAMGGSAAIEVDLPGGVRIQVRDAKCWPVVGGWIREVAGC